MLDLHALPKADIHRHLEGCIRVSSAFELAQKAGQIPADLSYEAYFQRLVVSEPTEILAVLRRFDLYRQPFQGLAAVRRLFVEAVADAVADNIRWLELRISLLTLARAAQVERSELLALFTDLLAELRETTPLERLSLILVVSRQRGVEGAWRVVEALRPYAGNTITGVDFAADEMRHSTAEFHDVARELHEGLGLPLTVHTGEGVPTSHVAEALAMPGVRRLGHALSLADSDELMAQVRERGLVVEVCPTSNQRTRLVPDLARHPAVRLRQAGVHCVLCSDDPTLFNSTLTQDLELARSRMGWSDDDIRTSQVLAQRVMF